MFNFLYINKEDRNNANWPQILDHPCRILIFSGSGSGKTNVLILK